LDQLRLVRRRQRRPLLGQRGVELLVDAAPQVVLRQALVVEDRPELVDQVVVDPLAQLVEHRVAPLHPGAGGALLHLVQALVEAHPALPFITPAVLRTPTSPPDGAPSVVARPSAPERTCRPAARSTSPPPTSGRRARSARPC